MSNSTDSGKHTGVPSLKEREANLAAYAARKDQMLFNRHQAYLRNLEQQGCPLSGRAPIKGVVA